MRTLIALLLATTALMPTASNAMTADEIACTRVHSSQEMIERHLEKFFSPSRCESDSLTAMGHGRMERASHGADGLFRC